MSRVLIIVQNLPVPFDRRVWLECQALVCAGYQVTVVCPKADGDPAYQVIDTVEMYKYRPYAPGGSKVGGGVAERRGAGCRGTWVGGGAAGGGSVRVEQDYGVHGLRASGGRVRPAGDAGVGGGRRRLRDAQRRARVRRAVVALMDDEPRRLQMGKLGRVRVEQELAWSHQRRAYLGVYQRVTATADRTTGN